MKKTTSKKLTKRLTQYGALTAAIAGVADATGQENIQYTDIADVGGPIFSYELNIDNDGAGNHDFTIEDWNSASGPGSTALKIWIKSGNAVAGDNGTYGYFYPFALNSGAVIDGNQTWLSNSGNSQWQTLQWLDSLGNGCQYASNWCDVTDKYLGLRFEILGETHFAWARLDAPGINDPSTWTIKDYAYHKTPDTAILAGQTTSLSTEEAIASQVKIIALNKSIGLYNLPEATNYKLYSMTGQEVLRGNVTGHNYVIETNTIASGIYIVEIEDNNTKATIRKKIVL